MLRRPAATGKAFVNFPGPVSVYYGQEHTVHDTPFEVDMTRRLLSLTAVLTFILAAPAAAQWAEERVDRTIAFQPGGTLKLRTFSGEVRISGTDAHEVVIRAVRRAPRERLDRIRLEIDARDREVRIEANQRTRGPRRGDDVVETRFDIQVPRETHLEIDTFSAPAVIVGVSGRHDVKGFSSPLRLTDVSGPIRARTFSGEVRIESLSWHEGDGLDVNTFSGDIVLRLPETARGELAFNTFSGDLTSDLPLVLQSRRGRDLRAAMNGGGGTQVQLKTFSGVATIRR
jgi:hypothetical protein